MTKTVLALALAAAAFGGTAAQAQSYSLYPAASHRTQWPSGLEAQERATTRQLNNEQSGQPTPYSYYPPQYSYVPPPQYSYTPPPTYTYPYAYPYDYPPRPWTSRYY